jgi:putative transposase
MKKTQFTEAKNAYILKQNERVISKREACYEHGISNARFYNWKSKFAVIETANVDLAQALNLLKYKKNFPLYAAK